MTRSDILAGALVDAIVMMCTRVWMIMGAGDAADGLGPAKGPSRRCAPEKPSSILTTLASFRSGTTGLEVPRVRDPAPTGAEVPVTL